MTRKKFFGVYTPEGYPYFMINDREFQTEEAAKEGIREAVGLAVSGGYKAPKKLVLFEVERELDYDEFGNLKFEKTIRRAVKVLYISSTKD